MRVGVLGYGSVTASIERRKGDIVDIGVSYEIAFFRGVLLDCGGIIII